MALRTVADVRLAHPPSCACWPARSLDSLTLMSPTQLSPLGVGKAGCSPGFTVVPFPTCGLPFAAGFWEAARFYTRSDTLHSTRHRSFIRKRWSSCIYDMNDIPKSSFVAAATTTGQTSCVDHDRVPIAEAARALGRLRGGATHKPQSETKWTGRMFGRRAWVGQPVMLDGQVCWIKRVLRGWACVKTSKIDPVDGPLHDYCSVNSLRPFRLPEVVALGRMKAGVKEVRSARKGIAK